MEQYKIFMKKTGLFDLLSKHIVDNLVDYAQELKQGWTPMGEKIVVNI